MMMFKGLRSFIRGSLAIAVLLTIVALVDAATVPAASSSDSFSSKDIIMILLGLLNTILIGIGVWLVGNDKELFMRIASVESKQSTRDAICDERDKNGEHTHKRATDDAIEPLSEIVDSLRKLLYDLKSNP